MIKVRIYYQDTDAGGVVYYGNYLRFFEASRTEFLRDLGVDLGEWIKRGLQFVVTHTEIDYRMPARYGDILMVETKCEALSGARIDLSNRAFREGDGRTIAAGKTRLACVGEQGKPLRIPREISDALIPSIGSGKV